jgi:hypothetical protein
MFGKIAKDVRRSMSQMVQKLDEKAVECSNLSKH